MAKYSVVIGNIATAGISAGFSELTIFTCDAFIVLIAVTSVAFGFGTLYLQSRDEKRLIGKLDDSERYTATQSGNGTSSVIERIEVGAAKDGNRRGYYESPDSMTKLLPSLNA